MQAVDCDFRAIVVRGGLSELDFRRVRVRDLSSRGTPFERRIPVGMPKIPPMIRNSAFYLYPSAGDADKGSNFGGTGFLIGVPSKKHGKYGQAFFYAVTNWHVAVQGCPVLRFNTKAGAPDIIDADVHDWEFDPRYDIAVLPVNIDPARHAVTVLHECMLVSKDDIANAEIGPGDDVFMVGRFLDHDGGEKNTPALRFGNISMNPTLVMQENGLKASAYCIDLHSRSGYSGSPVFVYRTPGADLTESGGKTPINFRQWWDRTHFFMILGIHFAQFPEMWEVTSAGKLRHEASKEPLLTDGKYIKGLSGMTCVLPAWTIREVLDMPKLKRLRAEQEDRTEARFQRDGYPPLAEDPRWHASVPDSEVALPTSESEANPNHREDFMSLLNAAVKKPAQED